MSESQIVVKKDSMSVIHEQLSSCMFVQRDEQLSCCMLFKRRITFVLHCRNICENIQYTCSSSFSALLLLPLLPHNQLPISTNINIIQLSFLKEQKNQFSCCMCAETFIKYVIHTCSSSCLALSLITLFEHNVSCDSFMKKKIVILYFDGIVNY